MPTSNAIPDLNYIVYAEGGNLDVNFDTGLLLSGGMSWGLSSSQNAYVAIASSIIPSISVTFSLSI